MQQHARDRHAAETVEVREERLSRRRGVQQQRERDRRATETEAQREGGWPVDYNQWGRSRSPKMLSIPLVSVM